MYKMKDNDDAGLFNDFLSSIGQDTFIHHATANNKQYVGGKKTTIRQKFKCPIISTLANTDPETIVLRYRSRHYLQAALDAYAILRHHRLGQLCLGLVQYGIHKNTYFASFSPNLVDNAEPAKACEISKRGNECRARERELIEEIWPTLYGMSSIRPKLIFFTNLETRRVFPIFWKLRCSASAKNAPRTIK